jgi:hypothetical protein
MTRVHVRLLGPCFKTGQMEQGTIATPGIKVREFPPTKGGPTPKGLFRLTEYQLQSTAASGTSTLTAMRRKRHMRQPTPHRAPDWPSTRCGGEREESRRVTPHLPKSGATPPRGKRQPAQESSASHLECPKPTACPICLPPNNFTHY